MKIDINIEISSYNEDGKTLFKVLITQKDEQGVKELFTKDGLRNKGDALTDAWSFLGGFYLE